MRQYQRVSENKFERLLIREFYEEQEDCKLEFEVLFKEYFQFDEMVDRIEIYQIERTIQKAKEEFVLSDWLVKFCMNNLL